jgi:sugar transferase (PEP-CTERM system associated)
MVRVFHHYFSGRKLLLFLTETVCVAFAGLAGALTLSAIAARQTGMVEASRNIHVALIGLSVSFVLALQFALYLLDLYDFRVAGEDRVRGSRLLRAAGATLFTMGFIGALSPIPLPSGALLGAAVGALTGLWGVRAALKAFVGAPQRILLIGDGIKAAGLTQLIEEQAEGLYRVVARVEPPREGSLATLSESVESTVRRLGADIVAVACDEPRGAQWVDQVLRCRVVGIPAYDGARLCERILRRIPVSHLRASDLVFADELRMGRLRRAAKRVLDVLMAGALLLLASPLMAVVAVLIKLDSKGPVFYRQERVGLQGRSYWLWKFRSMRTDAEKDGAVWAKADDDRVTRVGRFIRKSRIDEIPQIFNVLVGDMSFVGPRPERPVFVEQLKQQIPFYGLREMVKPGITGWAQIRYPYGASVEDARNKLEYDLYYVKNGSAVLDLAIVFHTVRHVLQGRGAR